MNKMLCPILSGLGDLGTFYCRDECRAYTDRVPSKCLMIESPSLGKDMEKEMVTSVADGMRGLLAAYKENIAEVDKERKREAQGLLSPLIQLFGVGSQPPPPSDPDDPVSSCVVCGRPSVMDGLCIECLEKTEGPKEEPKQEQD